MVRVGHSLGGALASIASLSIMSNIPSATVRLFTYGALSPWLDSHVTRIRTCLCVIRTGQPRTGDAAYADLVEATVGGDHIFRGKYLYARPHFGHVELIAPSSRSYLGCHP
jgi:hypothetical protein